MLRRYDWALGYPNGHPWGSGATGHGRSSVGLVPGTIAATCLLLLASDWPLFSGLVPALVVLRSFFMLPNITAITIMINSLGNHAIYSFKGKTLHSKLQSPSLGTPDLPCLPGHWVRRAVVGIHENWCSSRVETSLLQGMCMRGTPGIVLPHPPPFQVVGPAGLDARGKEN